MYFSLGVDLVTFYMFFMFPSPLSSHAIITLAIVQYTIRLMHWLTLYSGGILYILVLSMYLMLESCVNAC